VALYWSDANEKAVHGHAHLREMEIAIRARLEREGFGLDLFYNDSENTPAKIERILRARGIRGVILAPLIQLPHRHLHWRWESLSVVIAGSGLWRPEFHRVRFNHFEDIGLILHHLHHGGSQKIALATDALVETRSQRAMTGGFWAQVRPQIRRVNAVFETRDDNRDRFEQWLKKLQPDVLIVASSAAFGWVCSRFPKQQIVVTSGVLAPGADEHRGIRQNYSALGEAAAEQLLGQMSLNQTGVPGNPLKIYLRGMWVESASL